MIAKSLIIAMTALTLCLPLLAADDYPEFDDEVKKPIRTLLLDPSMVYELYVPFGQEVTTVMFPSRIDGIYAANVARTLQRNEQGEVLGDFKLTYTDDSYYFTLNALKQNARGSLNIVFNRKTYVIKLINSWEESKKRNFPVNASVTFVPPGTQMVGPSGMKKKVTPALLISLIEVAKCYDLFSQFHPEKLRNAIRVKPKDLVSEYEKFDVAVDEVYRFDAEDTVVFRLLLKNKVAEQLAYEPETLSVRLGDKIYYASMTDASGIIPPKGVMPAYFAITGTPTGGRNELHPDNKWRVLVSTKDMEYSPATKLEDKTTQARAQANALLNGELDKIVQEIAEAKTPQELDRLKAEAKTIEDKMEIDRK